MDEVVAILQARMSSSRLPGKVLMPILGKPMFLRQIERLERCRNLKGIVLATSSEKSDDELAKVCAENEIACFRGDLDNVLDRYYRAAIFCGSPTHIVRLTADCPLADPEVIDLCVAEHCRVAADYTSNVVNRRFPKGLDVEVMTFATLEAVWQNAEGSYDCEHVTPYIHKNPKLFKIADLLDSVDRSHWRWTVDTPDDIEMVMSVYEGLYEENPEFGTREIERFLNDHPTVAEKNGALGATKADPQR